MSSLSQPHLTKAIYGKLRLMRNLVTSITLISLMFLSMGAHAQFFNVSDLDLSAAGIPKQRWTSIQYGPDFRLYVTSQYGDIFAFKVTRNGANDYAVVSNGTEKIDLVAKIPQRWDFNGEIRPEADRIVIPGEIHEKGREVTGIYVTGTYAKPVIYVTSSDVRIGGGDEGDINLDTNSGVLSRLTWKLNIPPDAVTDFSQYSSSDLWDKVDLVRGLPRSEENHAINGIQIANVNGTNYLFIASGGNTNAGGPSRNFTKITEYALCSAILSVDLDALAIMELTLINNTGDVLFDGHDRYVYDLPTVDDPTRPNVTNPDFGKIPGAPQYIDQNDPWGGNDGLNQAKVVIGGPVQIFSPGYRNTYDLVITESRHMIVTDNGPNGGWGGYPEGENTPNVTNNYWTINGEEPASDFVYQGVVINNRDHAHLVKGGINNTIDGYTWGSYYAGHPVPIRANPAGAGLYTSTGNTGIFRTEIYNGNNDPNTTLPADWPPVPVSMANPIEGDYQNAGSQDDALVVWANNTNGIAEYTASNLGGVYKGDVLAVNNQGTVHRLELNNDGTLKAKSTLAQLSQGGLLDITTQGDDKIFPGTIWMARFGGSIKILEPSDFDGTEDPQICLGQNDPNYNPNDDYDNDGYANFDEVESGSDYCNGAVIPTDADGDKISDLNDPDDDEDGVDDVNDPFQVGFSNEVFEVPLVNELFASELFPGTFYELGFTGLMNNENPNDNYIFWLDDPDASTTDVNDIYGGATGKCTIYMTPGDARNNNQEKAFQFGVNVHQGLGEARTKMRMNPPFHTPTGQESYGTFIGTGDQDNYIKMVIVAGGVQVVMENNGSVSSSPVYSVPGLLNTNNTSIDFFFFIDAVSAKVRPAYALNDGAIVFLGGNNPLVINTSGALKTAIQGSSKPLAVGLIGSSLGSANEFPVTFDFFEVKAREPFNIRSIPDIEVARGSNNYNLNLSNYFDDDKGVGNLTYQIVNNTGSYVGTAINTSLLTLSFPSVNSDEADITVRAIDQDGLFVEQTFNVRVSLPPITMYRVNAGGSEVPLSNGVSWSADLVSLPSEYFIGSDIPDGGLGITPVTLHTSINQSPADGVLGTSRWDAIASNGNLGYAFPVPQEGTYQVELFFSNDQAKLNGSFDVYLNTTLVEKAFNPENEFGSGKAGQRTYEIYTTDPELVVYMQNASGARIAKTSGVVVTQLTGPINNPGSAIISVNANANANQASTSDAGAFSITNTSNNKKIDAITFDLSFAAMPDLVFDPAGTAGDLLAKAFTADGSTGAVSVATHSFTKAKGNGGFQSLKVLFNANTFDPNDVFNFSVEIDPISIQGTTAPGPSGAGYVSGAELAGTQVIVEFNDGTSFTGTLFSDGSIGGAIAQINNNIADAPQLVATNLSSPSVTTKNVAEINIFGTPNTSVDLLVMEGGQFGSNNPGEFVANNVIANTLIQNVQLNANGIATTSVNFPNPGIYYILAAGKETSGYGLTSNPVVIKYQLETNCDPLAAVWSSQDIGAVSAAGNVCFKNDVFTVQASGDDIFRDKDEFHFVYRTINCDGEMIARITGLENTDIWAKAGLMIRQSATPSSPNAAMVISATQGASFQYRETELGATQYNQIRGVRTPRYVRIARSGDLITGYISDVNGNWQFAGSTTISMGQQVLIGLAVSSHKDGTLTTATFEDVSFTCSTECQALPTGWTNNDVGDVAYAGSVCYKDNIYTVKASGKDIFGNKDEFHFVYQNLDCNGEIIARVMDIEGTNRWAKAGLMMRELGTDNAKNAMMLISYNGGASFQYREQEGGVTNYNVLKAKAPKYIRLVRDGDNFTGYISDINGAWQQVGSVTIPMASTIQVGLATTSHKDGTLTTTRYNDVSVKCNAVACGPLPSAWLSQDIGQVGIVGQTCHNENEFVIQASGRDIWNESDEFHYVYRPFNCDGEIIAQVKNLVNTNFWAKAGVMIRESLNADSRHATMLIAPAGASFQYRSETNGQTANAVTLSATKTPEYVRILRQGNIITGYTSVDGQNWQLVASTTIAMQQNVYIGLAVTSHRDVQLTEAKFDNVTVNCFNSNPAQMSLKLINADTDAILNQPISNNAVINLNGLSQFNIQADNLPAGTKSVRIDILDGPYKGIFRIENSAPHSLFGDESGDFAGKLAANGQTHTIKVEAYNGLSATGTVLESTTVTFSFSATGGLTLASTSTNSNLLAETPVDIVNLYPNQLDERKIVHVELAKPVVGAVTYLVYDPLGRVIFQGNTTVENAQNLVELDLQEASLGEGIYHLGLTIEDKAGRTTRSVLRRIVSKQ